MHFRDLKDILGNLLTLWFFATPIIYPMQQAPEKYRWILNLNPMTHLAISYQEVLFYIGPHGHWRWLMALLVGAIVSSSPAISCSIDCATASRKKCDIMPRLKPGPSTVALRRS